MSFHDRALGKCAGLHVNQGRKYISHRSPSIADPFSSTPSQSQSAESLVEAFHKKMIEEAIGRASEKEKVEKLAHAYSVNGAVRPVSIERSGR